jgi:transcription initiation factor IIE alpha subunit
MGIYDDEDIRYLFIHCRKCHYKGQIIAAWNNVSSFICPVCSEPVEQVKALDVDSCNEKP